MKNKNYLEFKNGKIQIICSPQLLKMLKIEYGSYYNFLSGDEEFNFKIYIYINKMRYKEISQRFNNIKHKDKNIYLIDRYGYVAINKEKKELIVIYERLNDNVIQFIGEILISLFGIILEKSGYFFIHAACVDKNSRGVAIIGSKNSGKTSLLNFFLQNGYNYVTNSHLGLKNINNYIEAIRSSV